MILADFQCRTCNHIYTVSKPKVTDDFPHLPCPVCNSTDIMRRYSIGGVDVCKGLLGNSENGYEKETIYHPSKFGLYKGKKIKSC